MAVIIGVKMQQSEKENKFTSIRWKFMIFSIVLFLIILAGGSVAFTLSMQQIVRESTRNELIQTVKLERISLEASVNGEIAIAMKMANSPLIKRHFLDPYDDDLKRIAFDEIGGYQNAFASKSVFWISDTDKEFYFDEGNHYTLDPLDPYNYWYRMTLYETDLYNFNINYNPEMQRIMLWINAPVFTTGRIPIGMVGTGIDLTSFVDSIYRDYRNKADLYFFNNLGEITGARDAGLITSKTMLDRVLRNTGSNILSWAKGNSREDIHLFNGDEGEIAVGRIPALDWFVTVVQPLTIRDYLGSSMTILFLIILIVVLLVFVLFNILIITITTPLKGMVNVLSNISKDWDITKRFDIKNRDEIGVLGEFLNQTFEKIHDLVSSIKEKASSLSRTGNELSDNMTNTNAAIEKINKSINDMKNNVHSQGDEVNKTTHSMENIIGSVEKLNEQITVQAENVAQSSSAIEEMLANIRSVTDTLVKNSTNISSLGESSAAGRTDLQKVSADIQEIAKESEGLLEINSVMQNIASQTNLLSMNAAIEAAHAGESGRGFAVVADEIRKLAENSSKQSKTISMVLKKIKSSIDAIEKSTGIVLERFSIIETEVETVSNQENHIRSAMEEQGIGSRHILEAITKLNSVTDQVQKASSDMAAESKEAHKQSGVLMNLTTGVAGSMDEMTGSADQINSAVTRVKEISQENNQNIEVLNNEISKFKVE